MYCIPLKRATKEMMTTGTDYVAHNNPKTANFPYDQYEFGT